MILEKEFSNETELNIIELLDKLDERHTDSVVLKNKEDGTHQIIVNSDGVYLFISNEDIIIFDYEEIKNYLYDSKFDYKIIKFTKFSDLEIKF